MTNRINGVFVAFEKEVREDDAQDIITAIKCFRNVADVQPNISHMDEWIAETKVRNEIANKLYSVLYPPKVPTV